MAEMTGTGAAHRLTLDARERLTMTGVTEVLSFDDTAVVLKTEMGRLTVHGRDLRLKTLTAEGGQVTVNGQVSAMIYEEAKSGGWLRRVLG